MVDKTYVFKLMRAKRMKKLHRRIDAACDAYNHCIALHINRRPANATNGSGERSRSLSAACFMPLTGTTGFSASI